MLKHILEKKENWNKIRESQVVLNCIHWKNNKRQERKLSKNPTCRSQRAHAINGFIWISSHSKDNKQNSYLIPNGYSLKLMVFDSKWLNNLQTNG